MKKTLTFVLIALSAASGLYFYSRLPDVMASHWDATGAVNGYMPKAWALFLIPALTLAVLCVLLALPRIDPLRKNIEQFRGSYDTFILSFAAFMLYIQGIQIAWNLGYRFNFATAMLPAFSALFYVLGGVLDKSKRNWFIGIRTPWTLSSDYVWKKTHRLGGTLFRISGIVILAGVFSDNFAFFVLGPVLATSAILIIYSYIAYKEENQ